MQEITRPIGPLAQLAAIRPNPLTGRSPPCQTETVGHGLVPLTPNPSRVEPAQPIRSASGFSVPVLSAVAITVLAWASAFVVIRGAGPHFTGGALDLARLLVGAALLGLPLVRRRWIRPTAREWLLVVVYGVAWFGAYNVFLNIAEHTLDAGTAAMIVNVIPILIALGAGIFLGEKISGRLAVGSGIAFAGVVLISLGAGAVSLGNGTGAIMALLAALTCAIGVLCQKVVLRRLPPAQVTWLGCVGGAVVCLPFFGELLAGLRAAPAGAVLGAVYLGVIPTAVAFSAWSFALARLPAAQLGVTTYVIPAIVVLLGFLVFQEIPPALAIVGGIISLVGVALSRKRAA